MPSLSFKNGVHHVRFRYGKHSYRRSLKTESLSDAEGAMYAIKSVLHRRTTGTLQIPPGVDPGDFIVSGGTLKALKKPPCAPLRYCRCAS